MNKITLYFNQQQMRGLYKHFRTGKLYFVEGIARDVTNPSIQRVIYRQTESSTLRSTYTVLPKGSLWFREQEDFDQKFNKIYEE